MLYFRRVALVIVGKAGCLSRAQLALEPVPDSPILVASCGASSSLYKIRKTPRFYIYFLSLLIPVALFAALVLSKN